MHACVWRYLYDLLLLVFVHCYFRVKLLEEFCLRMIEVLIDQEAVKSGAAASGEPWKYYDLGHGYCSYDFFEQCPHRMACAKCSFYIAKDSSRTQLLEAKANLQHLLQEIPLREEERAAVEDGLDAVEKLYANR